MFREWRDDLPACLGSTPTSPGTRMLLLGTRPRGRFPRFHVLGRETFLTSVEWVDGWPRVGPVLERHPAAPACLAPL
jgi:beta-xylosidase